MESEIFDGLTVVQEEGDAGGWRARLRVESSSRAFAGHFEGQPILPSVAHLVIVRRALQAMGEVLESLPSVRFRQVVRPGDVIEVSVVRPDGDGQCRFEIKVDGTLAVAGVARGRRDA